MTLCYASELARIQMEDSLVWLLERRDYVTVARALSQVSKNSPASMTILCLEE